MRCNPYSLTLPGVAALEPAWPAGVECCRLTTPGLICFYAFSGTGVSDIVRLLASWMELRPQVRRKSEKYYGRDYLAQNEQLIIPSWRVVHAYILKAVRRRIQRLCYRSFDSPTNTPLARHGREKEEDDTHHFSDLLREALAIRLAVLVGFSIHRVVAAWPQADFFAAHKLGCGKKRYSARLSFLYSVDAA